MKRKLELTPPIVNGCGIESYLDRFARLDELDAQFGAYVPKSWGVKTKLGNVNPTIVDAGVLLNSFALPTHTLQSWKEELSDPWIKARLKKPIIGSAAGNTPEEYIKVVTEMDEYVTAWQLNISCPNFEPGEKSVCEATSRKAKMFVAPVRAATEKPIIVKLSPNGQYVEEAEAVAPYADYICCGNTVGPGLVIDIYSRRPVLAGKYGGMSGPEVKPIKVRMTREVYNAVCDQGVGIMASGGIETWQDIAEYAIAGAEIFELGTVFLDMTLEETAKLPGKLWSNFTNYLDEQGMTFGELIGSLEART